MEGTIDRVDVSLTVECRGLFRGRLPYYFVVVAVAVPNWVFGSEVEGG